MTASSLKKGSVLQAIEVLRELNKQHSEIINKKSLFDEEEKTLYLQIMLKKIPKSTLITKFKVNLPHSLIKDTDEICLITGDLDKNNRKAEIEPDVLHYKALLDKHGVTQISKILTLRQLRTEYKTFEAKQKLLAAYNVFLADNKISECLPRILGKFFFKKRKFPIQINLKTSNLKQQIESALSAKVFYLSGHGNCCSSEVAYSDMPDSEILDNVMNMVGEISQKVPGNWNNILAIYLKTAKSKSIPIYVSYDNPNDMSLHNEEEREDFIEGELSTKPNVQVKVYVDGKVEMLTKQALKSLEIPPKDSEEKEFSCDEGNNSDTEDVAQLKMKILDSSLIEEKKKSKKVVEQTVPEVFKNSSVEKKGKKNKKNMLVLDSDLIEEKKKSKKVVEQTVSEVFKNSSMEKKGKKNKKNTLDESVEKNKKSAFKRKRIGNESMNLDCTESTESTETPIHANKRRKIDVIDLKKHESTKESCNKKKRQQRKKQKL